MIPEISMTSKEYTVTDILRHTKAKFWQDIEQDDILRFSVMLRDPGRGRGLYATMVTINNLTKGTYNQASLTETDKYRRYFHMQEVQK